MGCETTSYCKDIRGLGRVLPKVEKVIVGILGSKLAQGTGITPYPGSSLMIQYCVMYFGLLLHALKDSDIVSQ